jgi:glutamate-ammonia-ligase adenylyltransferase
VHAAPRTRRLFGRLEPLLLGHLGDAADPDAALRRFVRFVEGYGIRGLLLETLVTHPRLLDLLMRVFDASEYFSSLLIRRPAWIEELVRGASLDDAFTSADHLEALRGATDMAALRLHQQGSMLRIFMRDVLALNKPVGPWPEITAIAEASLIHAHAMLGLEPHVTVIGYGKFGGGELGYGADVDVVLIGEDPVPAEALSRAFSQNIADGGLFPLDTRLRPEGVNGPLVSSLANFEHYFTSGRAQVWEGQALTKARAICGPRSEAFTASAEKLWRNVGNRPDLIDHIRAMLQRVERERGSSGIDSAHFKTGAGGIVAAEFATQALQLRHGMPETNTLLALAKLREANHVSAEDHDALAGGYQFLREIEACLRREDNKAVSMLPAAEADLRRLGTRLGFAGTSDFLAAHSDARTAVARVARKILG